MHERLRAAMRRKGLKQKQLAELADISDPYLSLILSGKRRPHTDVLLRIIAALDLDPLRDVFGAQEAGAVFTAKPASGAQEALNARVRRARHPETLEIAAAAPGFGLLPGDLVVIDLGAEPADGRLVLAQMTLEDGNHALIVRRLAGASLVPDGIDGEIGPTNPPDGSVAVRGPIIAVVRRIED